MVRKTLTAACFFALLLLGTGVGRSADEVGSRANLKSQWTAESAHPFHAALRDGIGFSFTYEGQPVGPTIPQGWQITARAAEGVEQTTFRHPTGLTVIREARAYPDFEAVEYTLRFKNESPSTLPALGPIRALDLTFAEDVLPGVSVVSSGGGLAQAVYPPDTFAIRRHYFGPMTPTNGRINLTTIGGRSSNKDLPFFFVENEGKNAGVFVAFGWSGQWSAAIEGDFLEHALRLIGEVPSLQIRLQPGEEISGPRILIGCYSGPLPAGSNRLRRLIRDRFTPLLAGKKPQPITTYDHWWNIGEQFDEQLLRRLADAAAEIGQEYFLLDAAWYVGSNGPDGFSGGVGNWEEIDRSKFPSGLPAFADYVRSKGLQFGLWFEPERVHKDSLLAKQHPDWVIWLPNSRYGLLDYGRPEVEEWVRSLLDRYIRELGIRYIRYDFNIDPLAYWAAHDQPERKGISQIRHLEAFYRLIDWIRTRHPETVLEGCASGGRRIDLETARRFHTFWISDHTEDPQIVRFHLEGLNYFLPGNYHYVCYALPLPHQKGFTSPDIAFQSFFGGAFGTGGRIDDWPRTMKDQARRQVEVYKRIRNFLLEDYYPLTPQPRDLDAWEAWQFHNPKTGEGFVQAFRLGSAVGSMNFALKGLESGATYRFSDPDSGRIWRVSGAKAASEGIRFELTPSSSRVLIYQKSK